MMEIKATMWREGECWCLKLEAPKWILDDFERLSEQGLWIAAGTTITGRVDKSSAHLQNESLLIEAGKRE